MSFDSVGQGLREVWWPGQVLAGDVGHQGKRSSFSQWLYEAFPCNGTISYHITATLPQIREDQKSAVQPIILHVSCLSFDRAASLKLPPREECGYGAL